MEKLTSHIALENLDKEARELALNNEGDASRLKEHYEKAMEDLQSTIARMQKEKDEAIAQVQSTSEKQKTDLEAQVTQLRRTHELESSNAQLVKENEIRELKALVQSKDDGTYHLLYGD